MSFVAQDRVGPIVRADGRWFHVWMAGICALVAFVGFAPTYWLPLATGSLDVPMVRHVHGAFFFAWTLFFVMQTMLVANGRTAQHRQTGKIGAGLAAAMVLTGFMVAASSLHGGIAAGFEHAAKVFLAVPLTGIVFFGVLVGISIAHVKRPAVHKRLMLVATIAVLEAPVARLFMLATMPADAVGPPPVSVALMPALAVNLLLVAAMIHDWKTRGRTHAAYLWAGAALVAVQLLRMPLSETSVWLAFAGWFASVTA
jgi:hypothetical protein